MECCSDSKRRQNGTRTLSTFQLAAPGDQLLKMVDKLELSASAPTYQTNP
jgi:hypothetical protein